MPSCRTAAIHRSVRRIRRFIDSGAHRRRQRASIATSSSAPHFGGFREEMDHVLLLDMAIHTFDAARFMVEGDPRGVYCREWEPTGSWYAQGSAANAIFELTGDVVFTYRGSWCAEGCSTSWESALAHRRRASGTLIWDGYDGFGPRCVGTAASGLFDDVEPIAVPPLDPTRPDRRASRRHRRISSPPSRAARRRRRAAATTSRASPWCSARSRAPKPDAASRSSA